MSAMPLALGDLDISRLRGISFDLFGTLLRLEDSLMPRLEIDGVEYRTLLAAPLRILAERIPNFAAGDSLHSYAEAVDETGRRLVAGGRRELPPEWTFQNWLERLGRPDRRLACTLASALMDATVGAASLSAEALPLLATLRESGKSLGLISNLADAEGGRRLLRHLKLDTCFDATIFSGDLGWRKPDVRIYFHAAQRLGLPPESLLHVGDEWEADIVGAQGAGFAALWVSESSGGIVGGAKRDAPICSLSEFADLLLNQRASASGR